MTFRDTVPAPSPLWWGGERHHAASTYDLTDPATGRFFATVPEATGEQAAEAARAAGDAFPVWAATPLDERAALLDRVADLVDTHRAELTELVATETGAVRHRAEALQVDEAPRRLRRFAEIARTATAESLAPADGLAGEIIGAPIGVAALITPYNVPLISLAGKIAPALVTGNTVVVKPAVQSPLAAARLVDLFEEAGCPPGVVNLITAADAGPSRALVAAPEVGMVSFTGSSAVGVDIARTAAGSLKRLLLELGGKGAAVVLDDVDVDAAVAGLTVTFARMSGQACTAPSRLLIHRSRYDEVVERVTAAADALVVGPPDAATTDVGPVISKAHRDRVLGLVERAVAAGARRATSAAPVDEPGFYVRPTLLADCDPHAEIMQEEVFGPVVAAAPFDTEDEAVAIANGTRYGLADYVWTGDPDRGRALARRLRGGTVGLNTSGRHSDAAFGGTGLSGVGREGGRRSLTAYTDLRSISWPAS